MSSICPCVSLSACVHRALFSDTCVDLHGNQCDKPRGLQIARMTPFFFLVDAHVRLRCGSGRDCKAKLAVYTKKKKSAHKNMLFATDLDRGLDGDPFSQRGRERYPAKRWPLPLGNTISMKRLHLGPAIHVDGTFIRTTFQTKFSQQNIAHVMCKKMIFHGPVLMLTCPL